MEEDPRDAPEVARRRRPLGPSWLEADGRIYSLQAITLRFCLLCAFIGAGALSFGWRVGVSLGLILVYFTQLYQIATLQRMVAVLQGRKPVDDPRPYWLVPGWLEFDGRHQSAAFLAFRLLVALTTICGVLWLDHTASILAIVAAYGLQEGAGVFTLRVMGQLVEIEVQRRLAVARGEPWVWKGGRRNFKG